MPVEPLQIKFPFGGLHEGAAYADQPAGTTPSCLNVRGRDPITDRLRGGQRNGAAKYNASQVSGSNPVVEGVCVTRIDGRVVYTAVESESPGQSAGIIDQTALPSNLDCLDLVCDDQSNVYAAVGTSGGGSGINYVVKYNAGFQQQWLFGLPMQRATDVVKSVRLDGAGGIYAVISGSSTGPTLIIKLEETGLDFAPVRESWRVEAPNSGWWTCCAIGMGVMYAVEIASTGVYLHRFDDIDAVNPTLTWSAQIRATSNEEAYSITVGDDGSAIVAFVSPANPPSANGHVEKFGPQAPTGGPPVTPIWSYTGKGVGSAIVNKNGFLYTAGYSSGGGPFVRKLLDGGASVSSVLSFTNTTFTEFKGASSIDVDENGNVYVTIADNSANATDICIQKINAAFNAILWSRTGDDLDAANTDGFCVAVDPKYADAGATATGGPIAEFIYVGTEGSTGSHLALHKLRTANVVTSAGTPRENFNVCVAADGNIRKVTSSAVSTPSGSPTLDSASAGRWIQCVDGLNQIVFTDGRRYRIMDLLNGTNGTVSDFEAMTGEIPRRGRLLSNWQNALNVAGFEETPNEWAMSAVADWTGWDFLPPDEGIGAAVLGSDSRAGLCPDIINCLAPWTDDLQLYGGDHTIQRMTGHPLAEGRFDVVTDITGMAWGRPYCKDPKGRMYFVGAQGGFFVLVPGDTPDEITLDPLSDRFRDIDVGLYRIRLVWNDKEKGVHVFLTPYTPGTTTHFFWSARENAWWPDRFSSTSFDPMSVWVADGDAPGDRTILMGCQDGYVRKFSESAKDDDGVAMESFAYLPVLGSLADEMRLNNWRAVMGTGSEDVTLSAYELEQPDFNLINTDPFSATSSITATFSATLSAGRNDAIHEPVRGNAVMVRIRNATLARRWALESLVADRTYAGRARNR